MDELSDEDYNAEGTYRYPPNPRSWQQNAKFWLACPISDEELDEFVDYYREHYRHDPDVNAHAEPIMREWYKQHPGFKVDPGQGLADWDRQASREWDRARDSYPHRKCFISPQRARAVVRAAQMYQWSRYLDQEAINHTLDVAVPVKPRRRLDRQTRHDRIQNQTSHNQHRRPIRSRTHTHLEEQCANRPRTRRPRRP